MVAHTFDPRTQETGRRIFLNSSPGRPTQCDPVGVCVCVGGELIEFRSSPNGY